MRNKLILILAIISLAQRLVAQNNPHIIKEYPFVQYDSNSIKFFENNATFNHFYKKFDTLISSGYGKINIMQIGGSHIQADMWSNKVRNDFQQISPNLNGGRGFIFPFKLANTNNPSYYQITSTGNWEGFRNSISKHQSSWGVAGITATTKDSTASFKLTFKPDEQTHYDFNSIKVFHNLDSSNYCIDVIADSCISIETNHEIGYTEFKFNSYQERLEVVVYKTDTQKTQFDLYGLSLDNDDNGMVYHSIGVNGASTSSYLRNKLFTKHLKAINPDLVIFCIGINDALDPGFCAKCYEKNYDTLVSWIKQVNPNCNFLFVTNTDSYYKKKMPNKRAFEVQQAMINLATKYNQGYWDLFTVMGGLGSIKTWQNNGLAQKDRIHFTKNGYVLLGDLLFSALMKEYERFITIQQNKITLEN